MNPWFRKKTIISLSLVILGYYFVQLKTYKYVFSSTVNDTPAAKVWEYVSDFSNMKKPIPNMISFKIESESGGYEDWKYRVYYEEYVAFLPFLTNFAWADYGTKKLSENLYVVYSTHKTCFGSSLLCLSTNAIFQVENSKNSPHSVYTETIVYQCPLLFRELCKSEVHNQREHMKEMLNDVFKKSSR